MRIKVTIDWLEITKPQHLCELSEFVPSRAGFEIIEMMQPNGLYPEVGRCLNGVLVMRGKDQRQGMRMIMSGDPLRNIRSDGVSDMSLVTLALSDNRRPTRIDVAIDVLGDESAKVSDCVKAVKEGKVKTKARTMTEFKDVLGEGHTLYVGSKSSDTRMRVYDKRSEQGNMLMEAWTRIELQTRQDRCRALAQDIVVSSIEDAGKTACRAFCDFTDVSWYQFATSPDVDVDMTPVGRKQTNWEQWIKNAVLPSCEKHNIGKDAEVIDWLIEELTKLRRGGKI